MSSANGVGNFNGKAKEEDQGVVALVLDLAEAFDQVSLPVVWALQFEGCVGRAATDHHGHLARVQVELLAFCVLYCRMH